MGNRTAAMNLSVLIRFILVSSQPEVEEAWWRMASTTASAALSSAAKTTARAASTWRIVSTAKRAATASPSLTAGIRWSKKTETNLSGNPLVIASTGSVAPDFVWTHRSINLLVKSFASSRTDWSSSASRGRTRATASQNSVMSCSVPTTPVSSVNPLAIRTHTHRTSGTCPLPPKAKTARSNRVNPIHDSA